MSKFDIPEDVKIDESLDGFKSSLPFEAAVWWPVNGTGNAENESEKFGGWVTDIQKYDAMQDRDFVEGMDYLTLDYGNGPFDVYGVRWLCAAVIAKRFRWIYKSGPNAGQQVIGYDPGAKGNIKGHVQYLALVQYGKNEMVSIGPSILSAKGSQSVALSKAVDDFKSKTEDFRDGQRGNPDNGRVRVYERISDRTVHP